MFNAQRTIFNVQRNGINEERLLYQQPFFGDPAGIRTQGPYIKSVMLYQLSYGIKPAFLAKRGCKDTILLELPKYFIHNFSNRLRISLFDENVN
jgi:hypothetical protein